MRRNDAHFDTPGIKRKIGKEATAVGYFLLLSATLLFTFSYKNQVNTRSDAEGYYMYLPALTIYDGFKSIPVQSSATEFPIIEATGNHYNKYTFGLAILQLPFYAAAYLYTGIDHSYAQDGYSAPFQKSILIAALFYTFVGIFFLYRLMRLKYSLLPTAMALVCLFYGTNLFYYTYYQPGMPHAHSFSLWVALIWTTRKIYISPSWTNFAILSIVISLLIFIRPSNVIGALLILLWGAANVRDRILFIAKYLPKYLILAVPFILLSTIQIFLWKQMFGEYVFFSYQNDPGFIYWASPKIGNVLFHVHNGLFIYAPILIFSVIGLVVGIAKKEKNFILIAFILSIGTYIFASWWAWWFGGAYGHRCYIDLLPLLSLPLVYFISQIARSKRIWLKITTGLIGVIFVSYSMLMTAAYKSPWDGPYFGWPEYWEILKGTVLN